MPESLELGLTSAPVISGFMDVVSDNIVPILGLLGFTWGVYFVIARFNNAKNGRV